ncbi:MAG: hypothetical protein PHX78_02760 [bacterium]|nr:hypothetical protein [bacterium]
MKKCIMSLVIVFAVIGLACNEKNNPTSSTQTTTTTGGTTTGTTGGTQTQNNSIIGNWSFGGQKAVTFTTNSMIMYIGTTGSSMNYSYSASNGSGYYWDDPKAKVPFTYSFSGNTMTFNITGNQYMAGSSFTYVRM